MSKVFKVRGCDGCPFLYRSEECQGDPFDCQHPDVDNLRIGVSGGQPVTPTNCPLRAGPSTFVFSDTSHGDFEDEMGAGNALHMTLTFGNGMN